jgi:hypothetical protein
MSPVVMLILALLTTSAQGQSHRLRLSWDKEILSVAGEHVPGSAVKVWYIEAFCRPGSTDRDWSRTVIPHKTTLVERANDGSRVRLRSTLEDGVVVDHEILAGDDDVTFRVTAKNPTTRISEAHWAQPCIRVDAFTGLAATRASEDYLPKCFVFVNDKPSFLPTKPWATKARYVPGQVYCPKHVDRNDVNPRPLSSIVPSKGLMGCVSADGKFLLATAWEPYQELFQGVIVCLHSDFRIGGLKPGESKSIRGKIYLLPNDLDALVRRYERDFPEQRATK